MKTEGIVIKSITYKETSKIVYLYTPNGKVSIKAIGAKNAKKNTFGFGEVGNIVSFVSTDYVIKIQFAFILQNNNHIAAFIKLYSSYIFCYYLRAADDRPYRLFYNTKTAVQIVCCTAVMFKNI